MALNDSLIDKTAMLKAMKAYAAASEDGQVNLGGMQDAIEAYLKAIQPSEISVITPRSYSLPDLLDALEIHLVDYPTPENIHMQRKYLSDIRQRHLKPVSSKEQEVAEARAILADGDFLGVEESERAIKDILAKTDQPDELLPCPFCGTRQPILHREKDNHEFFPWLIHGCPHTCPILNGVRGRTLLDVTMLWNTRATLKRESGWQPIETAPKDRPIFAHALEHGGNTMLVEWNSGREYWTDPSGHAYEWDYWAEANIPPLPENARQS